jgi:hypothetical protein
MPLTTSSLPREMQMFLGSLYQQQAQILRGELPFSTEQTRIVSRALDNYRETVENAVSNIPSSRQPAPSQAPAPAPATGQQAGAAPTPTRNRTSLTYRITETLTSTPAGMTVAQIARKLNAQQPTIERILTPNVTRGVFVKEGNKYRMSSGTATAGTGTGTQPAQPAAAGTTSRPRNRARSASSGETATDRVATLVMQRPGITKAEVIAAMSPARPNHVGIWLARLCKNNRIAGAQGGQDGPYYPTSTTQRAAA